MSKHTPGPWQISESLDYGDEYWFGGNSGFTFDVGPAVIGSNDKTKVEEYRANAQLIAAAPELYALLDRINAAFYSRTSRKAWIELMAESKPLLQKASGVK